MIAISGSTCESIAVHESFHYCAAGRGGRVQDFRRGSHVVRHEVRHVVRHVMCYIVHHVVHYVVRHAGSTQTRQN